MKVVAFSVPKVKREAFRYQEDAGPYFYDQLHRHDEIQIMLIQQGEGTLIAGDYVGRFGPGDLYVIGGGQAHVFRNDKKYFDARSKLTVRAASVYFSEKYWGDAFWQLEEMKLIRRFSQRTSQGLQISGKAKTELAAEILQLKKAIGVAKLIGFLSILKKLSEAKGAKALAVSPAGRGFNPEEGGRMNAILSFTFREGHRRIYIREIAAIANLSVEAFCRYFKLHTRKTYTSFLNEVRISNACQLLMDKDRSIQEVCYRSGFNNISNFNRIFRRVTGTSPSRYYSR